MGRKSGILLIVAGVLLLALPLLYGLAPFLAGLVGYYTVGLAADYQATLSLLLMAIAGTGSLTNGLWLVLRKTK